MYANEKPHTRQRRLSSHGQQMLQHVLHKTSVETPEKAMGIPLQQQSNLKQLEVIHNVNNKNKVLIDQKLHEGRGNIFDRLTDTSQYTGTHKHRFDETGHGRGLDGRDRIGKGGYGMGAPPSSQSREAQYKGNTNTNTNVVYNDLSDFIVRR